MSKRNRHHRESIEQQVKELRRFSSSLSPSNLGTAGEELITGVKNSIWRQAQRLESVTYIEAAIKATNKKDCASALKGFIAREGKLAKSHLNTIANDHKMPSLVRNVAKDLLGDGNDSGKNQSLDVRGDQIISQGLLDDQKSSKSPLQQNIVINNQIHYKSEDFPMTVEDNSLNVNNSGQIGAIGSDANLQNASFSQSLSQKAEVDLSVLAKELVRLREELKLRAPNQPEYDISIGAIASAEKEALEGNKEKSFEHLSKAGHWVLDVAKSIGVGVAIAALKSALGLP